MTVKLRLLATFLLIFLVTGLLLTAAFPAVLALPQLQAAAAVTVTENANLRAGPGTSFARVGAAAAGDTLQVVGCNSDCTWYKTAAGAWIAGELLADPPATLPRVDGDGAQPGPTATPGTGLLKLPTATPAVRAAAAAATDGDRNGTACDCKYGAPRGRGQRQPAGGAGRRTSHGPAACRPARC